MGEDKWFANIIGLRKQSEENFWKWTERFKKRCEDGVVRMSDRLKRKYTAELLSFNSCCWLECLRFKLCV